jgi:hypothetical protein
MLIWARMKSNPCLPVEMSGPLFDYFVGAQQNGLRDHKAERLGGLEIEDQLELGRQLHRQVASKPALRFDHDGPDAVTGNPGEHGREAGARFHRVGAADRGVIEPINDDRAALDHASRSYSS